MDETTKAALARGLHEALCSGALCADNFTSRGTHDGCGECCSRFLPLTAGEAAVLRLNGAKARPEPEGALDLTCPFLTEERRCAVYGVRPAGCRAYDCSVHARDGAAAIAAAMPRGSYEMHDMREVVAWATSGR